nr:MAG TPA: hypothetical protein [Caudoviricetes sp.]
MTEQQRNIGEWILLVHSIYDFTMDILGMVLPHIHTISSTIHSLITSCF